MQANVLEWSHGLRGLIDTQDELIVFTLALIMGAMAIGCTVT